MLRQEIVKRLFLLRVIKEIILVWILIDCCEYILELVVQHLLLHLFTRVL